MKIKEKELRIKLVFLPPYSPDLNPVNLYGKQLKEKYQSNLSNQKKHLRNIIKKEFNRIEGSLSFGKKWI